MTPKERMIKAIRCEEVDRIPYCPFLAYYFDYLEEGKKKMGMVRYLKYIGADPLLRGSHSLVKINYGSMDITTKENKTKKETIFHTSKGDLSIKHEYTKDGNTWFLSDHPVKEEEDYAKLCEVFESVRFEYSNEAYLKDRDEWGEEALFIPLIAPFGKTIFQNLIETYVGTVDLAYHLMDFQEGFEYYLGKMIKVSKKGALMATSVNAEAYISWEDTSTTNISPSMFEKYILPELSFYQEIANQSGGCYIHHACGHMKDIIPIVNKSDIASVDSLSLEPTGNVSLKDFSLLLENGKSIIGGIEPVTFEQEDYSTIEEMVSEYVDVLGHKGLLIGNSDSCPPKVTEEKLIKTGELIRSL